ncbi:MAG: murein biosynthesis integral membrane protein MurJ [Rhodospirillales bacterium]|nr:murein biosynthesis integral membrane protein MurJ [Rhodospirillales bacterium]
MLLLRSIATVGGLTMVSRLFGFARDILIAGALGAGPVADAFFVAFKFPNLFRRLFAEGAFTAAFVPLFAGKLETDGKEAARRFAEQTLAVLVWALALIVAVMEIAMPVAMLVFAPGFVADPAKFDMTVLFARITFPYLLFVSLTSLYAGILNSLGRFAAAAATPILLNLCLIAAILAFAPLLPTPGHALAWGVPVAGAVQLAWLVANCRAAGVSLRLRRPQMTPQVATLLRRALPVAIGAGIYQINLLVDTVIASLLPSGSVSFLFYADRVTQLPLGVVGVAVGTALLPLLSRQVRAGNDAAAQHSQNRALEFSLFLTVPAAVALVVLAEPVVMVLFQRGAFDAEETAKTAAALAAFAAGLPAFILIKALTPGFFAREDTATPVKIAAAAAAVNVALCVALMGPLQHVGIAAATAASSWMNAGLLAFMLHRRGHLHIDDRLRRRLPRTLGSTALMAVVLYGMMAATAGWLDSDALQRTLALAAVVAAGLAAFAATAQVSGAGGLDDIRGMLRARSP